MIFCNRVKLRKILSDIIKCRRYNKEIISMIEYMAFLVGISATFLTLWSSVPQIKKMLKTKEADDVSKWLIISLIIGLALWSLYGYLIGDIVVIIANAIGVHSTFAFYV